MSHNEEMLAKIANEVLNIKNIEDKPEVMQALEKAFALGIERGFQIKGQQR